jgi:hypothetical protein
MKTLDYLLMMIHKLAEIKMRHKTSTQDNVFRMNMKNMNPGCPENRAYIVKQKKIHFRPPKQALLAPINHININKQI